MSEKEDQKKAAMFTADDVEITHEFNEGWGRLVGPWVTPKDYPDIEVTSITAPGMRMVLNIAVGDTEQFCDLLEEKHNYRPEELDMASACFVWTGSEERHTYFMYMCNKDLDVDELAIFVHELHHFIHIALDHKGMRPGPDSEEAYAHLQGYFFEKYLKSIQELHADNKKDN